MVKPESEAIHPTGKLLFLGFAFGLGLVYASLIPLHYAPLSWNETIERFRDLRWFNVDVYGRADWVANGIVVIPLGFVLAGAADRNYKNGFLYLAKLIAIMSCGILLVVAIEFTQIWYPPRTVSGNDIAAGCVGAITGPLLWPVIGRPCMRLWNRLKNLPKQEFFSLRRSRALLFLYSAMLGIYSVMPLDIMFNAEEWRIKFDAGRFAWLPGTNTAISNNYAGWLELTSTLFLSSARMIPVGFLAHRSRVAKHTPLLLIGFPIMLELMQAPIFTRYTTFIDILCGWLGGLAGLAAAANWRRVIWLNQLKVFRLLLVMTCSLVIVLAFLGRFARYSTVTEIQTKWNFFWAPPFSKYYYTTEFLAASNFVGKAITFAVLGFLVANLRHDNRAPRGSIAHTQTTIYASLILLVALCVELPQIYLEPFIADASDLIIYLTGATTGWIAYNILSKGPPLTEIDSQASRHGMQE